MAGEPYLKHGGREREAPGVLAGVGVWGDAGNGSSIGIFQLGISQPLARPILFPLYTPAYLHSTTMSSTS